MALLSSSARSTLVGAWRSPVAHLLWEQGKRFFKFIFCNKLMALWNAPNFGLNCGYLGPMGVCRGTVMWRP